MIFKQNLLNCYRASLRRRVDLQTRAGNLNIHALCKVLEYFYATFSSSPQHIACLHIDSKNRDSEQIRDIVLAMLHVNAFDMTLERHMIEESFGSEPFNISIVLWTL